MLAAVDIEKVNSINEFLDTVITENRLNQAVEVVKHTAGVSELGSPQIGDFIRWVFNDVIKEESDVIDASGLEKKEIGGAVAKRVKEWLFKNVI